MIVTIDAQRSYFSANSCRRHERPRFRLEPPARLGRALVLFLGLLERHREIGVPGDVNLVAYLDLIEHRGIDDPPAVFPAVRSLK
jgi:hypothetical protein